LFEPLRNRLPFYLMNHINIEPLSTWWYDQIWMILRCFRINVRINGKGLLRNKFYWLMTKILLVTICWVFYCLLNFVFVLEKAGNWDVWLLMGLFIWISSSIIEYPYCVLTRSIVDDDDLVFKDILYKRINTPIIIKNLIDINFC
jgi:hypothetical protein